LEDGNTVGGGAPATSLSKDTGSPPMKGLNKEEFLVIDFFVDAVIMLPVFSYD
jgi:hypothetical protein